MHENIDFYEEPCRNNNIFDVHFVGWFSANFCAYPILGRF